MRWTAKYTSFYGRKTLKKKDISEILFESLKTGHAVICSLGVATAKAFQNLCEYEKSLKRLEDFTVEPDCPWPRRPS